MGYSNNESGGTEHWDWQGGAYSVQKDSSNADETQCLWNEEDLSYMLEDATPVKACGDLAYHVNHSDVMQKEPEEIRESSSQSKRRRMLQFDSQGIDSPLCSEDISSVFLQSNESEDSLEDIMPQAPDWISGFPDVSATCYETMDQLSDDWLAECLNDTDMSFSPNDMDFQGASDIQIDISEFCSSPLDNTETNAAPKRVVRSPCNIIFKGKKSLVRAPTKLASSVVYPFAFIKPCGFDGDVTLKDINQRIQTPPQSKSTQKEQEPPVYPTSAFSGKPVVGKTKIRTEGGKGSITIMRTKG